MIQETTEATWRHPLQNMQKIVQKTSRAGDAMSSKPLQAEPTQDPQSQHSNSRSNAPNTVQEKPTQDPQIQLSNSRSTAQNIAKKASSRPTAPDPVQQILCPAALICLHQQIACQGQAMS